MAFLTDTPRAKGFTAALQSAGTSVWNWLVKVGERRARTAELSYYMSMTDEELAKRGLRREDVVRHVFRDRIVF